MGQGFKAMRGGGGESGYLEVTVTDNYRFYLMGTLDGELVVPTSTSRGTVTQTFDKGRIFFAKLYGEGGSKSYEISYIIDPGDETNITLSISSGTTLSYTGEVKRVIKAAIKNSTPEPPDVIK